jgi:type II secretory pathway component PulC
MPKWSRDYLLTSILAGIAAVLSVALLLEWVVLDNGREQAVQAPPAKTAPAADTDSESTKDFELPSLDEYEQMAERPLFMENRRPGAETQEAAAEPPPKLPLNLKLMGIVFTPEGKKALMADAKGKYKRLKVQETLDSWTLVELGPDKVVMQQGEERKELMLLKTKPKAPPGPQPPPGAPPRPVQKPPPPQPTVVSPEDENGGEIPEEEDNIDIMDEEAGAPPDEQ